MDIKDNPHVSTTLIHNWGRTGISTGGFTMEDMPLADRYRIGEEGRGFYYAMEGYTYARALIGATCCGAADTALKMGVDYIRQRKSFGKPLAAYQGINFPAAERFTDIESARLLTYKAAWMADEMYEQGRLQAQGCRALRRDGEAPRADYGVRDVQRSGQLVGRDGLHARNTRSRWASGASAPTPSARRAA